MQYSRQDRLACIKQLGNKIEQRKLLLLRDEVNHNLQLINKYGSVLAFARHFMTQNSFSPEQSTVAVINIRTTTPSTSSTTAYRPIVYPTPPRPTQVMIMISMKMIIMMMKSPGPE